VVSGPGSSWSAFLKRHGGTAGKPLQPSAIPWPAGDGTGNVLSIGDDVSVAERTDLKRNTIRRWHPDKFAQKFGKALGAMKGGPAARLAVVSRVKTIAQKVNDFNV
jgi:hypothetical protein